MQGSGMTQTARCFVGIPLSGAVSRALAQRQSVLQAATAPGQVDWLEPADYHLTLQFIGNIESPALAELSGRLSEALARVNGFVLPLERVSCFPDARSKVVAVVATATPPLLDLVEYLGQVLQQLGVERDARSYQPHVTLGRIRQRPLTMAASPLDLLLPVERVVLYQSLQLPAARRYDWLAQFELRPERSA